MSPALSLTNTGLAPFIRILEGLAFVRTNQADKFLVNSQFQRRSRMPKYPFRVGRARTGLGLFATEPIKKRAFIVEYKGPRLSNEKADRLEARGSKYMYQVNDKWTIDGSSRKNVARYANHSCRPNAESDTVRGKGGRNGRGGRVIIRAIKNIKPGEEIVYDYGDDYFKYVITPQRCKCDKCMKRRAEARRLARLKAKRRTARTKYAAAKAKSARKTKSVGKKKRR